MKLPVIPGFHPEAFEKYFKNTGFLMIGKVGSLAIKMLVGFTVANYLGKEQNGIINYANSFVVIFFAIAALGLDQFIVRDLVNLPKKKGAILGTAISLKVIGALLIIPLCIIIYPFFSNSATPVNYVLIISFIGFFQAFNVIEAYYQAQVKAKNIMLVNIIANIISALVKLLFVYLKLPIIWFIWALVIDAILLSIGYCSIYLSQHKTFSGWTYQSSTAKELLKKSWPLMFSAVLVVIYMKIDQLMIGRMLGEGALGIYSTVVPLSEAWYFVPVAIVSSVFPAIIHAKREDEARYLKRLQNLYDLMVIISLLIALTISLTSDMIYQLVYKPEYASGAQVLSIHVWAGIFVFLGSASGQYLINEGYTKIALLRTGLGAIVNIILNIVLIPKMGISGAAWATLAAYATATFVILFTKKTRAQGFMMLKSLFLISFLQKIVQHFISQRSSK